MNKFTVQEGVQMPKRATMGSAGYDFYSPVDFIVPAHDVSATIDTGVSVQLDSDKVLMCHVRSSFGFNFSVNLVNCTGVVDSDYFPQTIKCKLINHSDKTLYIYKGDKIMQGVIMQYFTVDDDIVTAKRTGGIGSTGK